MLQFNVVVLLVLLFCIFCSAHRINREDAWEFLLRNAMTRVQQTSSATTCEEAFLHPGCCKTGCHVLSGDCYCDNICHLFNDCCCDVPEVPPCDFVPSNTANRNNRCLKTTTWTEDLETTSVPPEIQPVTAPLPPTCSARGLINSTTGCCEGDICYIMHDDSPTCYCDRRCFDSTRDENCCDNLMDDGCYPRNCSEAGIKSCCTPTEEEDCKVKVSSNNSCYCDMGCHNRATNDCCSDIEEICPQSTGPSITQIENFLSVIEKDHSALYERMAAAFWRRYNNAKRKHQKIMNEQM